MKYKFYNKNDKDKAALDYIEANNQEEAERIASKIKQLTLDKFLKLFIVKIV
tara:strand:- start:682 stop:837 length:156 start_codon:yes stop_codon:yes gene_type:complete